MKHIKRMDEMNDFEKAINDFTKEFKTIPVNKSKEEVWKEHLDEIFPAPALIGGENYVKDGRLVEVTKMFYVIDKDFNIIEEAVAWENGELSKDVRQIMDRYGFEVRDIDFLDDTIEDTINSVYNSFCVDNVENDYKVESSQEFKDFEKKMSEYNEVLTDRYKR